MFTLLLIGMLILAFEFDIQPVKAEPKTVVVPDDYSRIQEAINRANPGDTIYVKTGIYYENVVVNRSVLLVGEDGNNTIIDGSRVRTVVEITTNDVSIVNFTIKDAGFSFGDSGIKLSGVEDCKVYRNILMDNGWNGMILLYSPNNFLFENVVINSGRIGIILYDSNNNTVEKNVVMESGTYGIAIQNSNDGHIIENVVVGSSDDGIAILDSNENLVSRNIVTQGRAHGIRLDDPSDNNTITKNTVTNNRGFGFWMWNSNNNVFHHNLCNNTSNVLVLTASDFESANTWDAGYPSGGNFWSDYIGVDERSGPYQNETGSDGIGDKPYVIAADNQDRYPLMKPWKPLLGDINDDRIADGKDIAIVAKAFGSYLTHPRWNPYADINQDGMIEGKDIVIVAKNFGKTYP